MWRAFWRWVGTVFSKGEGAIDEASDKMMTDHHVMGAKYSEVIRKKKERFHQLKDAIAALMHSLAASEEKLKGINSEIVEMELDLEGAKAAAKTRAAKLQKAGKSREEILEDSEFREAQEYHADTQGTLEERRLRASELQERIDELDTTIDEHKLSLRDMARELEKLGTEKSDAIADVISNREIEEVNNMLAGVGEDATSKDLEALRMARGKSKAKATIAKELGGTDARAQRAKFRAAAREKQARDSFANLIDLADETESKPAESAGEDTAETTSAGNSAGGPTGLN